MVKIHNLLCLLMLHMVGAIGFEPTASCSRSRRSTGLSHAPKSRNLRIPAASNIPKTHFHSKKEAMLEAAPGVAG